MAAIDTRTVPAEIFAGTVTVLRTSAIGQALRYDTNAAMMQNTMSAGMVSREQTPEAMV